MSRSDAFLEEWRLMYQGRRAGKSLAREMYEELRKHNELLALMEDRDRLIGEFRD